MPGPRVGLSITPAVVAPGSTVTFDVCGVLPNGPAIVILETWNGVPINGLLFGALADPLGELSVPLSLPPALTNSTGTFRTFAFDPLVHIVQTLPATLAIL
jgi:hypothetical protein